MFGPVYSIGSPQTPPPPTVNLPPKSLIRSSRSARSMCTLSFCLFFFHPSRSALLSLSTFLRFFLSLLFFPVFFLFVYLLPNVELFLFYYPPFNTLPGRIYLVVPSPTCASSPPELPRSTQRWIPPSSRRA